MAGTGPALPGACAPAARQAVGSEPDAGPRGLSGAERQTKPGRLRATRGPRCREDGQGKRPQGAGRLAEIWARRRRRLCRRRVDVAPRFRVPLCPGRPRAGPHRRDRDGLAHRPLSEACASRGPSGPRRPHALHRALSCRRLSRSGGASSGAPHADHGRGEATSCLGTRATPDRHEPGDLEQTMHPTPS